MTEPPYSKGFYKKQRQKTACYNVYFVYNGQMQTMSATDAKQTFSLLLEKAQRAPVAVTKQSREVAVVMSRAEYDRLTRLNIEEFQRFRDKMSDHATARGLTLATLRDLLQHP